MNTTQEIKMSLRLVLSSVDSSHIYPDNKPYDFRVYLTTPISLTGYWTVSLLEFSLPHGRTKMSPELFVFSNLCDNTVLAGHELPLLRRVYMKNEENIIYQLPYEVPLRIGQFQDVHVYIKDSNSNPASFIKEKVTVTLHLKKHPFHI